MNITLNTRQPSSIAYITYNRIKIQNKSNLNLNLVKTYIPIMDIMGDSFTDAIMSTKNKKKP